MAFLIVTNYKKTPSNVGIFSEPYPTNIGDIISQETLIYSEDLNFQQAYLSLMDLITAVKRNDIQKGDIKLLDRIKPQERKQAPAFGMGNLRTKGDEYYMEEESEDEDGDEDGDGRGDRNKTYFNNYQRFSYKGHNFAFNRDLADYVGEVFDRIKYLEIQ